jgi:hypothetical protein
VTYPAQYPPQQPSYPSPAQPQYPPQYPSPQQGYPPAPYQQPAPAYPPQQPSPYYPQAAQQQAAPPPPVIHGTLDEYYDQPAASGKSLTFDRKPVGFSYTGVVARSLTNADVVAQTDIRDKSRVITHPDGRPKFVMVVPLQLQPSAEFPDGRAAWYCKGSDRAELDRAMEAAGVPLTAKGHMPPPEAGAVITITYTGERPIPGLNPQKMKMITYRRPQGGNGYQHAAEPAEPAIHLQQFQQAAGPAQPAMEPQYAPAPQGPYGQPNAPWNPLAQQYQDPAQQLASAAYQSAGLQPPQHQQPQHQQPQYAPLPAPEPPPGPQPYNGPYDQGAPAAAQGQPAVTPVMAAPPDLSPDQQRLLAQLTGQG